MQRSLTAMLAVKLVTTPLTVQGYAKYATLIPNGGGVPDTPNVGHLDPAGETGLSTFGEAFSQASNVWSATICQEDADGDSYTNGQELGDPCCTWTESSAAGLITDGLSNPSDASKIPTNPELLAGCTSGGDSATSTNSTGSGSTTGIVATVAPAKMDMGKMPPDDDEDDSSESAVLIASASMTSISSVAMGLATVVAIAVAW